MNRDERAVWARRLTAARRVQNMSQRELAERSGVSEKTINDMDLEKKVPNPETLMRLAEVLEVEATPGVIEAIRDSWPENVRTYSDVVGLYLMLLPEQKQNDAGDEIIRLLLAIRDTPPNGQAS